MYLQQLFFGIWFALEKLINFEKEIEMQIKVIKKDSNLNQNNESVNLNSRAEPPQNNQLEQTAERNISKWVSELRRKKELEFLNTRNFLQGMKHAV
jgi:hypothetical protein